MTADDEASAGGMGETGASPPPADTGAGASGGEAPADINTYIGSRLRQVFDDIASQPIPDRFLQLMQDLDKR